MLTAVDLFQGGREIRDRTIPPERQPARVPDENISKVLQAVNAIAELPGMHLHQMNGKRKVKNYWKPTIIGLLTVLSYENLCFCSTINSENAANNMNNSVPPFFERIGPESPNYYWYLSNSCRTRSFIDE